MPSDQWLVRVRDYWAADLEVGPEALEHEGVTVAPGRFSSIFVFQTGRATVVSTPPAHFELISTIVEHADAGALLDEEWWRAAIGDLIGRAIGPAYLGYADTDELGADGPHPAPMLDLAQRGELDRLAEAVGEEAWEHSGLGKSVKPVAACWRGGQIVAAAGYDLLGGVLAHIGVASDPAVRGLGYGRSAVAAIARQALDTGLLAQYRTLEANTPSMAIAHALGFHRYATTLALRRREG
jgi:GNAT superfamily N-acetyltransferase